LEARPKRASFLNFYSILKFQNLSKKQQLMKKYFYPKTFLLSLFISVFFQLNSYAQLLTVSGQKIVNSSTNQEVILNAINFGNKRPTNILGKKN